MARTIIEEIKLYTFEEASKPLRDKIRDDFNYNGDIYSHCMIERLHTLKEVACLLNAGLDYSISCVPDRGEYIRMNPKYEELDFQALWEAIDIEQACPLTGVCYDHDIIDHLSKYNLNVDALNNALDNYITSIHEEYESMLTDEYLLDHCEANNYEFTNNGKLY